MTREEFEQYAIKNGLVVWSKEQSELAIKALEELPKRRTEAKRWKTKAAQIASKKNRWIPVSERLPEAGEYVGDVAKYYLVQNEYGDMLVARYNHSGYWEQIYQLKPIGDEIVAWMPLPEPFDQQESEEQG